MRRLVGLALLALAAGEGCASKSKTAIDVTIDVDGTLGLMAVAVSASATGKPNLDRQLAVADVVRLTIAPTDLVDGTVITLEARGVRAGATLVIDRAIVHLRLDERVTAKLRLMAECAGVECPTDQTCQLHFCVPIPTVFDHTDGGTTDVKSGQGDATNAGSGSTEPGDGGGLAAESGSVGDGRIATSSGGASGSGGALGANSGTATGGAPPSGMVAGVGGRRSQTGGSTGMGGGSGSGGAPGTAGTEEVPAMLTLGPAAGSSLDFGTVTFPGSATEVYVVTNTGQQTSSALGIVLTDVQPFRLDVPPVGNCSNATALPGGGSCTISVTFTPRDIMAVTAILSVSAGVGPLAQLTLVGRGKSPTSGHGVITEFTTPTPQSGPIQIAASPSGDLYFTESNQNRIGRLTTAGVITEFPVVPVVNVTPASIGTVAITVTPDGNVWFTIAGYIVRMSASGSMMTAFPLPEPNSYASSITPGPDGNVWFVEAGRSTIGRITPSGAITEFVIPSDNAGIWAMTFVPNGDIWFVESTANKIGRITTAGVVTEFPIPRPYSYPSAIALGPDGNLWFTGRNSDNFGTIGRITQTGDFAEFLVRDDHNSPQSICAGLDGNMWFTEGPRIGRVTTAAPNAIAEWPLPTPSDYAIYIVTGADGNLWFTEQTGNKIGRIVP